MVVNDVALFAFNTGHDAASYMQLCVERGRQGPWGAVALYMHELLHRSGKWGVNHITHIVVYSIL